MSFDPSPVSQVFNRLLTCPVSPDGTYTSSPLTPADLLVALHDIDLEKNQMKTVISATGYCFSQPAVFTHEVLALVLQQLVERDPLPILIMRTVMQVRIVSFV